MRREHKERAATKRASDAPHVVETQEVDTLALRAEMDDILEDIDKVLEKNAEEFINAFVQYGGE